MSTLTTPPDVRIPAWLVVVTSLALVAGVAVGLSGDQPLAHRLPSAVFHAGAFGYVTVSLVDFYEHFALERAQGGSVWGHVAIPWGESLNHAVTLAVIVAMLVLGRPLGAVVAPRDAFVLVAPALVLALGWRDELVYHRRRCAHREDVMHTVAHLGLATMMAGFFASRLVP